MRSILSILTFLAFFTFAIYADEESATQECQCDCTVDELIQVQELVKKYENTMKACTMKEEMHERVMTMYTRNNEILSKSWKDLNQIEDQKKKKENSKPPPTWEDEKESLLESIEEIDEEKAIKEKKFKKLEKDLRAEIEALQFEIMSLTSTK